MTNAHTKTAAGIRDLADWIEQHPELALPMIEIRAFPISVKEPPAMWVKALGGLVEKDYGNDRYNLFRLRRRFGPIKFEVIYDCSSVCRRVVKGVERVVVPAVPAEPEQIVEREIVEWICEEPILAAEP